MKSYYERVKAGLDETRRMLRVENVKREEWLSDAALAEIAGRIPHSRDSEADYARHCELAGHEIRLLLSEVLAYRRLFII